MLKDNYTHSNKVTEIKKENKVNKYSSHYHLSPNINEVEDLRKSHVGDIGLENLDVSVSDN
jgi:hypothetical protein